MIWNDKQITKTHREYWESPEDLNIWQWASKHVDYSLQPAYDSEAKGKYDPEYIPLWKEPAEALTDPLIRFIVIRKCSRAGGTETILNGIRFIVSENPVPILYVGAQETTMKDFFEERIERGLEVTEKTRTKLKEGKVRNRTIYLQDCQISTSYFGSDSGPKQKGFGLVVLDEFSTSKKFSGDQFKKRIDNYRTGKVVMISSLDPHQPVACWEDPLNLEYLAGDQRLWHIQDESGKWFLPDMGLGVKSMEYGVKWDDSARRDDGVWILQRVYDTAHYLTPEGRKLSNSEFQTLVDAGKWIPTNADMAAPKTRSYSVDGHLLPFEGGDLGHIAVGWIEAQRKGKQSEKIWIYENQPNHEYEEKLPGELDLEKVYHIRDNMRYEEGVIPTDKPVILVLIADVQALYIEYGLWALGVKDQYLITHKTCSVLENLDEVREMTFPDSTGVEHSVKLTVVDSGYRTTEVYDYCRYRRRCIAIKGDTGAITKMTKPIHSQKIDQYPDGRPMPHGLRLHHFHPTIFRDQFVDALYGYEELDPDIRETKINIWLHRKIDKDYAEQVTAEVKDEQGKYVKIRRKNEQFDIGHYAFAVRYMLKNDILKLKSPKKAEKKEKKPEKKLEPVSDEWSEW